MSYLRFGLCLIYASIALGLHVVPLLPHRRVLERKRKERQLLGMTIDELQIDPLYQGIGTHYVDLWVGCPPQRQTLIVDTGSADTAFPCYGCQECGAASTSGDDPHPPDNHHNHIDSLYRQNESSCFQYLQCTASEQCPGESMCLKEDPNLIVPGDFPESSLHPPFLDPDQANRVCHMAMAYVEGSVWIAIESMDRAYTGGSHFAVDQTEVEQGSFNLTFGCQTSVQGLFETQLADGIMGMMISPSSYWWQLYDAEIISKKQFSLCFTTNPSITYGGTDAGAMVFGGYDDRLHTTPMIFAEMIYSERLRTSAVQVILERILFRMDAGESIVPTTKTNQEKNWYAIGETISVRAVVDSGATSTHLTNEFLDSFQETFLQLTGLEYSTETPYTFDSYEEMIQSLPTIVFQFKASKQNDVDFSFEGFTNHGASILVALPPSSYMKYYSTQDEYMAKIFFRRDGLSFGANFLTGKDVFFDVENKRMGFAESSCDYLSIGDQRFNHTSAAWEAQQPFYSSDQMAQQSSSTSKLLIVLLCIIAVVAMLGLLAFRNKKQMPAYRHERIALQDSEELSDNDDAFGTEMVQTSNSSSSDSSDGIGIL